MKLTNKRNQLQHTPYNLSRNGFRKNETEMQKPLNLINQKNAQYFPVQGAKNSVRNSKNTDISRTLTVSNNQSYSSKKSDNSFSINSSAYHINQQIKKRLNLQKEIRRLQRLLNQKQQASANQKRLEAQLVEAYRILDYYEGKIKEFERIVNDYEKIISANQTNKGKVHEIMTLIQQFKHRNIELSGQNEKKDNAIEKLSRQIRLLQGKYHNLERSMLELKKTKILASQPYENHLIPKSHDEIVIKKKSLSFKNNMFDQKDTNSQKSALGTQYRKNIYTSSSNKKLVLKNNFEKTKSKLAIDRLKQKIDLIQKQIDKIKKQNLKLNTELSSILKENISLKIQSNKMKQFNLETKISSNQLNQIIDQYANSKKISKKNQKKILKPILSKSQKAIDHSKSEIKTLMVKKQSQVVLRQQKQKKYTFKHIKQKSIRRLILNLIRQVKSYQQIIIELSTLINNQDEQIIVSTLTDSPYKLEISEAKQFIKQADSIKDFIKTKQSLTAHKDMNKQDYKSFVQSEICLILQSNIKKYNNITYRKEFIINKQLANKLKNYEEQLAILIKRTKGKMDFNQAILFFEQQWGLSEDEIKIIQLWSYKEMAQLDILDITQLGDTFISGKWINKYETFFN